MSRIKQKLASLEKKSRVLLQHHGIEPNWPLTHLSKEILSDEPDRRLVEPCDTDPETYWDIRYMIAWGDEDYAEIARLNRNCPRPKEEYDWGPPSEDGELTPQAIKILDDDALRVEGTMKREREAVAAAQRRLGRPEKARPSEAPPSEPSPYEASEYA